MRYISFVLLLTLSVTAQAERLKDKSCGVYEALLAGKKCTQTSNQSLECSYKAGDSLHISIAGIGSADTGIAFLKSDWDGEYYGKYGLMHGCVIITETSNFPCLAFISPKNGKVYQTWQECQQGL